MRSDLCRQRQAVALVVLAAALAFGSGAQLPAASIDERYDVVIYGGTSAAVVAAVEARRLGKSVAIVCPETHLGGLTSGGLGWTDSGDASAVGGLAREFYHRIWLHYQRGDAWTWQRREDFGNRGQGSPASDDAQRTMWTFEPHVAEQVFEDLIRENDIPVRRNEWLDRKSGVAKEGARIISATMLSGNRFQARIFVDATYEGDLMAAAGVDYRVGRESSAQYDEPHNGVQVGVLHHRHHFGVIPAKISPYVAPGDSASGVLSPVSAAPPGVFGAADNKIQAYCYRACLTKNADNRLPLPKPAHYDSAEYELLVRIFDAGWRETFNKFDPIPNAKTDVNNHGPMSSDNIGANDDYPEASYERRREIADQHRDYQQGLYYFIATDPRVPRDVQREMNQWGLAKDEFADTDHWPRQLYVREARRMVGAYIMTEHEVLNERRAPQSVGMGSYALDSHNVQRYIATDGSVQNEGDVGVPARGPYAIAYGSLVPNAQQCDNLLVPVCVSSTHIAYGSIRMEPVFMILAQSAAAAAAMAIDKDCAVQNVPYDELHARLQKDGQVLEPSKN